MESRQEWNEMASKCRADRDAGKSRYYYYTLPYETKSLLDLATVEYNSVLFWKRDIELIEKDDPETTKLGDAYNASDIPNISKKIDQSYAKARAYAKAIEIVSSGEIRAIAIMKYLGDSYRLVTDGVGSSYKNDYDPKDPTDLLAKWIDAYPPIEDEFVNE